MIVKDRGMKIFAPVNIIVILLVAGIKTKEGIRIKDMIEIMISALDIRIVEVIRALFKIHLIEPEA